VVSSCNPSSAHSWALASLRSSEPLCRLNDGEFFAYAAFSVDNSMAWTRFPGRVPNSEQIVVLIFVLTAGSGFVGASSTKL